MYVQRGYTHRETLAAEMKSNLLQLRGYPTVLTVVCLIFVALLSVVSASPSQDVAPRSTLPRPNPVYTTAERELLRAHFSRFLHLKAAEPFVHVLPGSNILFQIISPAPRHLSRYCGRGTESDGAMELDMEVVDIFGKRARRRIGDEGGGAFIVELDHNRRLFPGEQAVLRRIPEHETWRVYYPSATMLHNDSGTTGEVPNRVWTEVITVTKVWTNRVPRENCERALQEELGYDPYYRDALMRKQHPDFGIGLQSYTFPLPGEEEGEEMKR